MNILNISNSCKNKNCENRTTTTLYCDECKHVNNERKKKYRQKHIVDHNQNNSFQKRCINCAKPIGFVPKKKGRGFLKCCLSCHENGCKTGSKWQKENRDESNEYKKLWMQDRKQRTHIINQDYMNKGIDIRVCYRCYYEKPAVYKANGSCYRICQDCRK